MSENKRVALVTGAAGFIGSHLSEALIERGWSVKGVDLLLEHNDAARKRENFEHLAGLTGFERFQVDLRDVALPPLLEGVNVVFHLAALPGVRTSWGDQFRDYARHNVEATARLLEACRECGIPRLVYASSSSVYGDARRFPASEEDPTHPISPYGVTKLAAEHLVRLYGRAFGVETISLRFFTVYGPRQRPDMAFFKFIRGLYTGEEREIYGDGTQTRDFTFVSDAVASCVAAADRGTPGGVYNIGGGSRVPLKDVLSLMEDLTGKKGNWQFVPPEKGDPKHTAADTTHARSELGYQPAVNLRDGLKRQIDWLASRMGRETGDGR